MIPWDQVKSSPEYQALDKQQRFKAQIQYFDDVIAPNIPEPHRRKNKIQFLTDVSEDKARHPVEDMSAFERGAAGAGKAVVDIGRGIGQLAGFVDQKEIDEAKERDAPLLKTTAGTVGNVLGNVATAAPTILIPGANTYVGATALGASLGALQPVASDESRATNTLLGAAGGLGGRAIAGAVGRAVKPVRSNLNEPLQELAGKAEQYGIPLNAAQKTGSRPLKIIDSVLDNLPFTADSQAAAKSAQATAFNKAVLSTVGENSDLATPNVLNSARTRIGSEFERLSGNNSVSLGDEFLNSLVKVDSSRTNFSSPAIKRAVDRALDLAAKGKISGNEYQKVRTTLTNATKGAWAKDPELGQALKTIRSALDEAAESSLSKADREAWQLARKQWANLKVVEKAAAPTSADAVSGNVSVAKLAHALKSADPKGFTYGTRSDELSDLARIGQAFLKQQIPDSGTAQRTFWQSLLTNPLEFAWKLPVGGAGAVSVPAQKLINSKAGQKYLTNGLTPDSKAKLLLAKFLTNASASGGAALNAE